MKVLGLALWVVAVVAQLPSPPDHFHFGISATNPVGGGDLLRHDVWAALDAMHEFTPIDKPTHVYTNITLADVSFRQEEGAASCTQEARHWPPQFMEEAPLFNRTVVAGSCPAAPSASSCDTYSAKISVATISLMFLTGTNTPVGGTVNLGEFSVPMTVVFSNAEQNLSHFNSICFPDDLHSSSPRPLPSPSSPSPEPALSSPTPSPPSPSPVLSPEPSPEPSPDDSVVDPGLLPPSDYRCAVHLKIHVDIVLPLSNNITADTEQWHQDGYWRAQSSFFTAFPFPITQNTSAVGRPDLNRTFTLDLTVQDTTKQCDISEYEYAGLPLNFTEYTWTMQTDQTYKNQKADKYHGVAGSAAVDLYYAKGTSKLLGGEGTASTMGLVLPIYLNVLTFETDKRLPTSLFVVPAVCPPNSTAYSAPKEPSAAFIDRCFSEDPSDGGFAVRPSLLLALLLAFVVATRKP